ncbi:PREDICTED: general transcription factor 3C polypeptide 5-like isoform X1 [Nicotiana attenuata]|uniref:general transcription factor 3C polypeptide 5-like isoform X1 n=1 Tax=Nicotiana attenuata TaxID=49451 RepID=UPI0009059127|nr:PREDICTED: general transcription factor 3C polypeptide 5-like isoform X1 [Nicotiana attenuata]XP_019247635.1 PREDICTED: general transcription factor 3C polypeptide 5-like isoform X1 [Nicotiana attenuata]
MGIIKDGSVSGILPSNKVFAVHYPAYPSSMERAIETLGGIQGIVKARTSQSNKLELHFRPEDPYSHPAFGELRHRNNFLLKISKTKVRDVETADSSCGILIQSSGSPVNCEQEISRVGHSLAAEKVNESRCFPASASKEIEVQNATKLQEHLSANIVSHVAEAYHFNGMVDYQHVLAVQADVARRKKRQWAEVEPKFEKGGLMDVDQEDLMILLPPLFSLKDMPEDIVLKSLAPKRKQEVLYRQNWEREMEQSLNLDVNIKEIPKPVDWEKHILQGSEDWRRQKVVSELFEERQIWVKESLAERLRDEGLKLGEGRIKRLLFRVAYYFSSGPFRRFWIRKGYDPRKDPESRIYQNIDFRVLPELRSYCESHASSGLKHRWDDICAFRVFPYKCQISLQLCELKDNYIQQEIRKPSNQETCDNTTGWFSSHILDCLRLCIAVRFMSVCPHPDAESLLKTVSARFEKSKRIHTCVKVTRPEEQGKVHKEAENNEVDDQAGNNEVDEPDYLEDDEDDFEDDNVEDEMDAYEPLDLVGQEGEVSIHDDPHTNHDNVSRDYLQELFGNFPFSTAGVDEVQDDQSLGEYQIYDQYIDGSYSEDEDY